MTPEQIRHAADVVIRAKETIEAQQRMIVEMKDKITSMESGMLLLSEYAAAVHQHNMRCVDECCEGVRCGYAGYLKRTGRRCPTCPVDYKVDVMPSKGSA